MTKEFENNEQENIWSILNIQETTDIKKIRHAYAVMSKSCHPEKEPEKFQQLYHAYQEAIKWAKAYKKREKNVSIDDTKLFAEKSEMEYHTEEQEKKTEESESSFSMFNNLEQNQIEKEETETTEEYPQIDIKIPRKSRKSPAFTGDFHRHSFNDSIRE